MSDFTIVVHLKYAYDVYIGRPGPFGNPFVVGRDGTRDEVIEKHRRWFHERIVLDHEFRSLVETLRGKRLGCYCKPRPCHGDVIAEWLNESN